VTSEVRCRSSCNGINNSLDNCAATNRLEVLQAINADVPHHSGQVTAVTLLSICPGLANMHMEAAGDVLNTLSELTTQT